MVQFEELIKNINVLLADDDEDYILMTENFLISMGYNVDIASNGKEVLEKLSVKDYQILLLDYFMPELNGEEVINEIRKTNNELIIILQTGFSGQKPPLEMMKRLNIQSYYDKTEGINRLNYELASAVRIFGQQNQIEINRYRTSVIGNLITGVAQEIKSNLLSISAGIEYTNMLVLEDKPISKDAGDNINKFYYKNKESLERIDKVLTSIIAQTTSSENYIMSDNDIIEIIGLVLNNFAREKNIDLTLRKALRSNSYINGSINDIIFITCELIKYLISIQENSTKIDFVLTEDEDCWFFVINSEYVSKIPNNKTLVLKKLVVSFKDVSINFYNDKIEIKMKKVI